ncbi:unnamed protein product [Notodromas monacha]|uniref:Phenylalanine--tRNA ligase beta subunit n=1 Tax=Notodromas monacha TaxID=399045 RepID=A0A7R9BLI6_9CRUS|nr:unnamed protein product [Notodromas monacha]CAG0917697.1 unnamed protein product [Notodromas monacha]
MPTISVKRDALMRALECDYSEKEFEELCFQFGIEIDEVVTNESASGDSSEVEYKIEVSANRYDLLSFEGLVAALRTFLSKSGIPEYVKTEPAQMIETRVKTSVGEVRPFVVTAVVRGVTLTEDSYNSIIDLQEKLHHNLCRKRALVAIGIHDLDTIQAPFVYEAKHPEEIKFKPLNQVLTREYTAAELMELYATDSHLKPYLPIIKDKPKYPVITDSRGTVLSLPPIINGDASKLTLKTKDFFIECTATLLSRAVIVLDTIVTMLSTHADPKFHVESTKVIYEEDGRSIVYPSLAYRTEIIDLKEACEVVGLPLFQKIEAKLSFERMGFRCNYKPVVGTEVEVVVPPTRHDIIHAYDLYEELAVSYGYDNIEQTMPKEYVIAEQFNLNVLTDKLRDQVAQAGFTEAATFTLCSLEDLASKVRLEDNQVDPVTIANPKTQDFQVCRTSLMPGLLRTLAANKKMPIPLRIFEIADVILKDSSIDVGARNERRLCALHCGKTPGFEVVHGLLDRVMQVLSIPWTKDPKGYFLQPLSHPTFLEGHCAEIIAKGKSVGRVGVLHPEVILKFDLSLPCAVVEINIEPFL